MKITSNNKKLWQKVDLNKKKLEAFSKSL